jgi:hypothetical protein
MSYTNARRTIRATVATSPTGRSSSAPESGHRPRREPGLGHGHVDGDQVMGPPPVRQRRHRARRAVRRRQHEQHRRLH